MALSRRALFAVTNDTDVNHSMLMLTVNGNPTDDEIREARQVITEQFVHGDDGEEITSLTDEEIVDLLTNLLVTAGHNAVVSKLPVLGNLVTIDAYAP